MHLCSPQPMVFRFALSGSPQRRSGRIRSVKAACGRNRRMLRFREDGCVSGAIRAVIFKYRYSSFPYVAFRVAVGLRPRRGGAGGRDDPARKPAAVSGLARNDREKCRSGNGKPEPRMPAVCVGKCCGNGRLKRAIPCRNMGAKKDGPSKKFPDPVRSVFSLFLVSPPPELLRVFSVGRLFGGFWPSCTAFSAGRHRKSTAGRWRLRPTRANRLPVHKRRAVR